jgi:hypothetical protein
MHPGGIAKRLTRLIVLTVLGTFPLSPHLIFSQDAPSAVTGLRIIVVGSPAEAQQILDRLKKGEDFAALA